MNCPSCSRAIPEGAIDCPVCATKQTLDPAFADIPTRDLPLAPATSLAPVAPAAPIEHVASDSGGKFTPGTVLAKRYRIATILGHGGPGEVYQADDLRLSQRVALKFLPPALLKDHDALARFHAEVSAARRISHPNVCRVYDVGEASGRSFLSMEYIDGEDLASLLRRIGRLPPDKALEIARQLCAGVAAAHQIGVVHRDLKPANVMIDSRGRAHITDFGLAGVHQPDDVAYTAPEQLARGEVSVRSDIYSLGLILYETFTGRRAFEAATKEELLRRYEQSSPSLPSTLVEGMDPLVEQAILRCLERDPAARPPSALDVARVLPGGDPLGETLAAGETPSPEMVAAAGGEGALSRRFAWTSLSAVVAGLAVLVALSPFATELGSAPLERSGEELEARARATIEKLGYTDPPGDSASRFRRNTAFMVHRSRTLPSPVARRTIAAAAQSPMVFLYRQSPRPLAAGNAIGDVFPRGMEAIFGGDPPMETAGMVNVELDARGSLLFFRAVPQQLAGPDGWKQMPPPDWPVILEQSGLDPQRFARESPVWYPPGAFDAVAGWQGTYAQDPSSPVHVIAAAFRGKLVYFQVIGAWNTPWREAAPGTGLGNGAGIASPTARFASYMFSAMLFLVFILGAFVARSNIRHRRSDTRGAARIGGCLLAVNLFLFLSAANHAPSFLIEWPLIVKATGAALFEAAFAWLLYMALEPFVRRRWPELLIGWSRLLDGRFRDPMVGREILIGALTGVAVALVWDGTRALPAWFDIRGWSGAITDAGFLSSIGFFFGRLTGLVGFAIASALQLTVLASLALVVTRRKWLALCFPLFLITAGFLSGENWIMDISNESLCVALILIALHRSGLLAAAVAIYIQGILGTGPLTASFSYWYSGRTLMTLAVALGIALYGFRIALGNKSVFGGDLLAADAGALR